MLDSRRGKPIGEVRPPRPNRHHVATESREGTLRREQDPSDIPPSLDCTLGSTHFGRQSGAKIVDDPVNLTSVLAFRLRRHQLTPRVGRPRRDRLAGDVQFGVERYALRITCVKLPEYERRRPPDSPRRAPIEPTRTTKCVCPFDPSRPAIDRLLSRYQRICPK